MPRRFTSDEEAIIRESLKSVGRELMGRMGVKRTSIDELAEGAGISKGSFYRFFDGKEALALSLFAEWERGFHAHIEHRFLEAAPTGRREVARVLTEVILDDVPKMIGEAGMAAMLQPDEIAHLTRRASPEEVQLLDEQDLRLFQTLAPLLRRAGLVPAAEEKTIVAALRIVTEGVTADRPVGGSLETEHYRAATEKLLEGLFATAFQEGGTE